jgi:hypothetical protein
VQQVRVKYEDMQGSGFLSDVLDVYELAFLCFEV